MTREEVRAWVEDNAPASLRGTALSPFHGHWGGRTGDFPTADHRRWFDACLARGWTAPGWPVEYGGGGLDPDAHRVLVEEFHRLGLPLPLVGFGLTMIGPILLASGSDEQKRRHLPAIVRGEIRWCQGYSEPEAGSDLASLRTRGEQDADALVVNGQKIWTSHAEVSDWIFCLVRTDPAARKQDGISFLLIDMRTPGILVRPIRLISGASPFCEVFFTDVRVPLENVVGGLHRGWTVAKSLLQHERTMVGESTALGGARPDALMHYDLRAHAARAREDDPVLLDAITRWEMDREALRLTVARLAGTPASSILKVAGTELNMRCWELAMRIAGPDGLGWDGDAYGAEDLAIARTYLRSRANSIEGGTTEIQLDIVARQVLGLPR